MTRTFRNVLADPPTLASAIAIGATTATLATDPGTEMPTTGPFSVTIDSEVFASCSRSGTTLTLGSAATAEHAAGADVVHALSRADAEAFVQTDDSRLTDARTPTAHTHPISEVTDLQTTLDGKLGTAHEADTTSVHGIADTSTLYRSGGTDVAVADGGTGASSASGARTNLGLAIGTDVASQGHTHTNLPSDDQKDALDSAGWVNGPPSGTNPFVAQDLILLLTGTGSTMGPGFVETNDTGSLVASSLTVDFNALGIATKFDGMLALTTDNAAVAARVALTFSGYDFYNYVRGVLWLPDGTIAQITDDSDEIDITLPTPDEIYMIPFRIEASVDDYADDLLATATWWFGPATGGTTISFGDGGHMHQVGF